MAESGISIQGGANGGVHSDLTQFTVLTWVTINTCKIMKKYLMRTDLTKSSNCLQRIWLERIRGVDLKLRPKESKKNALSY